MDEYVGHDKQYQLFVEAIEYMCDDLCINFKDADIDKKESHNGSTYRAHVKGEHAVDFLLDTFVKTNKIQKVNVQIDIKYNRGSSSFCEYADITKRINEEDYLVLWTTRAIYNFNLKHHPVGLDALFGAAEIRVYGKYSDPTLALKEMELLLNGMEFAKMNKPIVYKFRHINNLMRTYSYCFFVNGGYGPDFWAFFHDMGGLDSGGYRISLKTIEDMVATNTEVDLRRVDIEYTKLYKFLSEYATTFEKTSAPPSKTKASRTKRGRPAKNTMEFFLSKRDKKVREIGLALAAGLEKMHLTPNFIESNRYAYFTLDSMKVCGIRVLSDKLRIIYAATEKTELEKSEFVYNIKRDQLGGYASDIKTNADMNRALQIVKDICGIKKAPKSPNANKNYDLKHTFFIKGKRFQAKTSIDALRQIIDYMAETDPQFIQRLPESKKSFISQEKFARHYKIKAAPGWYLDVNLSAAKIKKVAGMIRKASSPQIRDTMTGDIFGGRSETAESKKQKSNAKFKFHIEGLEFQADSTIGAVKKIITYLARVDPQFLKRVESLHRGKTRKYIARDKDALYPGRPDLQKFSFEIPTAPGWYLGTNYNVMVLKKIAALAKETAEPKIRDTMVGSIFKFYSSKSAAEDDKTKTNTGDEIPDSENVTNEFKSSFKHDYDAAEFERDGNKRAAEKKRDDVKRNNFGSGLEWDVVKAIAGFSNSHLEEGHIWVGIKDKKGGRPTVLGLEPDYEISHAKDWEDDFRNWINSLLGNCIRDYNKFTNIKLSFLQISDKRICLLAVKKASKPMYLYTKQNPNITKFYRRNSTAPRTDLLDGEAMVDYIKERYPDQST